MGILFGGKSAEHEISLRSARNVIDAINKDKYDPVLIGIDKSGKWLLNESSNFPLNSDNPKLIRLNKASDSVALIPQSEGEISNLSRGDFSQAVDVASKKSIYHRMNRANKVKSKSCRPATSDVLG